MGDLLLLPSNVENTEADGMIPKKNKRWNKKLTHLHTQFDALFSNRSNKKSA